MPIVTVDLSPGRSPAQKQAFMEAVTRLAVEILNCPLESVDVIYREIPASDWAHAGKFYAQAKTSD